MMYLLIYLLDVLPHLPVCIVLGIFLYGTVFGIIPCLMLLEESSRDQIEQKQIDDIIRGAARCVKKCAFSIMIVLFLAQAIPSQTTLYILLGTYAADKSGIPQEITQIVKDKIHIYAKETGEELKSLIIEKKNEPIHIQH